MLVEAGAAVNVRDKDGWSPLRWATIYRKTKVAEYLRKHGGDQESAYVQKYI